MMKKMFINIITCLLAGQFLGATGIILWLINFIKKNK